MAPQALFLLNNPFVQEQTRTLAKRVVTAAKDAPSQVDYVYRLLYGRLPTPREIAIGLDFLKRSGGGEQAWQEYGEVLLCVNEFIYVD